MMLTLENLKTQVTPVLQFIDQKWSELTGSARFGHHDTIDSWKDLAATSTDGHLDDLDHENPYLLFLPHDFVYPGGRFQVQFYWDSYFILLSLLRSRRVELARGTTDNLLYLVRKHGLVIPNRKRWAAGSQLPFLSHMVREVYQTTADQAWLAEAVGVLEQEYRGYWLNEHHLAYRGLSRYHALPWFPPESLAAITMDTESTWDLSPRFDVEDILDLLPVDLNCNLFDYESNFAYFREQLGDREASLDWSERARQRAAIIDELMWDEDDGLYYDYNFRRGERKKVKSLAAYSPLFSGCADPRRALRLADNLALFEQPFGLATCDRDYGYRDRQWNYPVGWAPLHWMVFRGLRTYGFEEAATWIAMKWLDLNYRVWKSTGALYEKYNVVLGTHEVFTDHRYVNQTGFGWTNGVFHALVEELNTGS